MTLIFSKPGLSTAILLLLSGMLDQNGAHPAAAAGAAAARVTYGGIGTPCTSDADCTPGLLCEDNQLCACTLGHVAGVCLRNVTQGNETCHFDEQCFEMYGERSVCHEALCSCQGKVQLVELQLGSSCEVICETDKSCEGVLSNSGEEAAFCNQVQAKDHYVHVCQSHKTAAGESQEEVTTDKPTNHLSRGGVIGITIAIIIVGVVAYGVFYYRRPIMNKLGFGLPGAGGRR